MAFFISPRANKEELYAYFVVKDYLFKNKDTFVGETGVTLGEPDLMAADGSVGCEVTTCETRSTFDLAYKLFGALKNENFSTKKLKFINPIRKYKRFEPKEKAVFKIKSKNVEFNKSSDEILEALEYVLIKKLTKLNNNSYYAPHKIYLIVLSDFANKKMVSIEQYKQVFDNVSANFDKQFDGVFVTFNDQLYLFKDNKIHLLTEEKTFLQQKTNLNYYVEPEQEM